MRYGKEMNDKTKTNDKTIEGSAEKKSFRGIELTEPTNEMRI
jgi:hypothetical protein